VAFGTAAFGTGALALAPAGCSSSSPAVNFAPPYGTVPFDGAAPGDDAGLVQADAQVGGGDAGDGGVADATGAGDAGDANVSD
jgi:hypothetical protein